MKEATTMSLSERDLPSFWPRPASKNMKKHCRKKLSMRAYRRLCKTHSQPGEAVEARGWERRGSLDVPKLVNCVHARDDGD